jgi:glutamate dehydrogenase (NAD(P)+)
MGTNEQVMAWFMDTYSMYQGRTVTEIVTGKPVTSGGTEGRREATGLGVVHLVCRALEHLSITVGGSTAIVQGFGNVGGTAAAELYARGVRIVGISDHTAAYYDPIGIDIPAVLRHVAQKGVLGGYSDEARIDAAALLTQKCDILVPAAMERVIDATNAHQLNCRIIAEGANGPTTPEADVIINDRRDIFVIPDILCNSGGVIVSYFEWVQDLQQLFWGREEVIHRLYTLLDQGFDRVVAKANGAGISNRLAAMAIGVERVRAAKETRGLFP